jgi:hypothetical protein
MLKQTDDDVLAQRLLLFKALFDKIEAAGIDYDSPEWFQLSKFATHDLSVNQRVDDLGRLKLEDLTTIELNTILRRAKLAIARIVEARKTYYKKEIKDENGVVISIQQFGPYYTSRALRRKTKNPRAAQRSSRASNIVKQLKTRRSGDGR